MLAARYWLVLAALPWAAAWAQPPGPAPGSAPAPERVQTVAPPPASTADEEFIEFLGEDDNGDAAWEDFLKWAQSEPQKAPPPPPGAKQS